MLTATFWLAVILNLFLFVAGFKSRLLIIKALTLALAISLPLAAAIVLLAMGNYEGVVFLAGCYVTPTKDDTWWLDGFSTIPISVVVVIGLFFMTLTIILALRNGAANGLLGFAKMQWRLLAFVFINLFSTMFAVSWRIHGRVRDDEIREKAEAWFTCLVETFYGQLALTGDVDASNEAVLQTCGSHLDHPDFATTLATTLIAIAGVGCFALIFLFQSNHRAWWLWAIGTTLHHIGISVPDDWLEPRRKIDRNSRGQGGWRASRSAPSRSVDLAAGPETSSSKDTDSSHIGERL